MVTCRRTNRSPGQGFLNKSHVGRLLYSYPGVSEDKGTLIDFVSPLHLYLTKTWVLKVDPYWHFRYGHRMKLLTYTAHPSLTRDTRHYRPLKALVLDQNQAWKRTLVCHSYFINSLYTSYLVFIICFSHVFPGLMFIQPSYTLISGFLTGLNFLTYCGWKESCTTKQMVEPP